MSKNPPSREAAEQAVRTLIQWAGDDPDREGLLDTPSRVVRAYEEFFAGVSDRERSIADRASLAAYVSFRLLSGWQCADDGHVRY